MTRRRGPWLPSNGSDLPLRLRRAVDTVGAVLRKPSVTRSFELAANACEVLLFWPAAIIIVAIAHTVAGPVLTLAGLIAIRLIARRPSIRALAWTSGGLYLGIVLLNAAIVIGTALADPLTMATRDISVLALSAGGLACIALTFALPGAAVVSRSLPRLTRLAAVWIEELAKGGLLGVTIGATVLTLVAPTSAVASDDGHSRALAIAIAVTAGIVAGGLRADRRIRRHAAQLERAGHLTG
jgi:hypothetical protein